MPSIRRATLIGSGAIGLWSTLTLLVTFVPGTPPFQLVAVTFFIGSVLMLVKWYMAGQCSIERLRHPWRVWLLGVGGLFGYHAFYFAALALAPPLEASLINYLWPLLIVVFSALLPDERLRWFHGAGALMGLAGTAILVAGERGPEFAPAHLAGYVCALLAAVTWAGYSVLSRRIADVPSDSVGGFMAATALLAFAVHATFETTLWPEGALAWAAVAALGLGPLGAAFFLWDHGVKRGDIRVLGAASYAAPLISTLLLIAFGRGEATWQVAAALLLIVSGAVLAAKEMLFVRRG
ncbi:MAG: EamA family transporter [Rhodospirillales bacterium]|nr:EamA family transporter [Rhodospirillales bacterium]MSP79968.1 EamA family transporter [Rhodospirillales bacterium]